MKIPGLYKLMPGLFKKLTPKMFGDVAGICTHAIIKRSEAKEAGDNIIPAIITCHDGESAAVIVTDEVSRKKFLDL